MSEADKMFKKLGYRKEFMQIKKGKRAGENWGEKFINEKYCVEICFDYIGEDFCIGIIEDDGSVYVGVEELQAINQKCKELGWLDE